MSLRTLRLGGDRRGEETTTSQGPGTSGDPLLDHLIRPYRSDGRIVRPRLFAIFRLITRSNVVGDSRH